MPQGAERGTKAKWQQHKLTPPCLEARTGAHSKKPKRPFYHQVELGESSLGQASWRHPGKIAQSLWLTEKRIFSLVVCVLFCPTHRPGISCLFHWEIPSWKSREGVSCVILFSKRNKNKKDVNLTGHQTLQWLTVGWEENLTQHSCWDFGIYISCTTTKLAPCFCQWPPPNSGLPTQACWEQVWVQVVPVKLLPTLMGKCLGNASSTADHCCYFSPERRCVEMPCWRTSSIFKRLLSTVGTETASPT